MVCREIEPLSSGLFCRAYRSFVKGNGVVASAEREAVALRVVGQDAVCGDEAVVVCAFGHVASFGYVKLCCSEKTNLVVIIHYQPVIARSHDARASSLFDTLEELAINRDVMLEIRETGTYREEFSGCRATQSFVKVDIACQFERMSAHRVVGE